MKKTIKGQEAYYSVDNPDVEGPVIYEQHDLIRNMPRIGKQYIDWDVLFLRVFREENKPMSADEAMEKAFEIITRFKEA